MVWQFLAGIATTCIYVAWTGKRRRPCHRGIQIDPTRPVRLLLWEHDEGLNSRIANTAGGRTGISHVSIDIGEIDCEDDDYPLMIECLPREGVVRSDLDKYGDRRCATIVLQGGDARETVGCVRAKIGEPYDGLGAFSGLVDGDALTCSTLIYFCLPKRIRELIRKQRPDGSIGVMVTPGQIAEAFGVKLGGPAVYVGR
jgi:hypothetical protein